jgi:hypothetical protein
MSRILSFALCTAALLLLSSPAGVTAQETQPRTFGAGWSLGPTYVTELNVDAAPGAAALDPGVGLVVAIHVDRWVNPSHRFGFRFQGSFEQPHFDWAPGDRRLDTLTGDISLLLRPIPPGEERAILPYLAAGLGGAWYRLGNDEDSVFEGADVFHDGEGRIIPTGVIGIGVDIPIGWQWHRLPVQLRVEAADHIAFRSPFWTADGEARHGPVHHLRFTIGAHSTLRRW